MAAFTGSFSAVWREMLSCEFWVCDVTVWTKHFVCESLDFTAILIRQPLYRFAVPLSSQRGTFFFFEEISMFESHVFSTFEVQAGSHDLSIT